ncbi:SDR family oxidoreductase [Pricia sp. S334]|uniref:SDR family oxidoreductase n=1 Tax=Pricia mediterranea TaxID=3076079 RepID=A0ABU3LAL0_9FLAO|nr:SDR family oxidoreductase [Pricia sp. S334]MDT7830537.1 SDR family oxidoreductase [Pricia sp. S334]
MENVLVAGAHGTTGKHIINILNNSKDYKPIAMIRKADQKDFFNIKNVETVLADLEDNLSQAVEGVDKVIFAAGSGGEKVVEVDQEGAKRLVDASKKAEIKKFVMLSSIGAGRPEKADQLKEYLKAKHKADEYLKDSGLDYTIVRPGTLNNEQGTGKVKVKKELESVGEIPREDVARILVAALQNTTAHNTAFEVVSGEVVIEEALKELKK